MLIATRKWMMVGVALLLILTLLAGCGGNNESASNADATNDTAANTSDSSSNSSANDKAQEPTVNKEPQEISFAIWGSDSPNAKQIEDTFRAIIANYKEKSGNTVKFNFIPDNNYRTWTLTQEAADNLPDVMKTKLAWVWEDYAKEQVIDMGPYLDKENPYNPGKSWKETFIPSLIEGVVNPANNITNSVPDEVVMVRMYYNKELFKKAGITSMPQSWEELMADAQKLKDAGIVPFSFANSKMIDSHAGWMIGYLTGQLDQGLRDQMDVDKDGKIIKNEFARATDMGLIDFTKAPFKNAFELLQQWSEYTNSDYNGTDMAMAETLWLSQKTAMIALGSWQMGEVDIEGRDFDFGVFPMPAITKDTDALASGTSIVLGGKPNESWTVTKNATGPKLDASIDFVQYLTSPEVQGKLAADLNWMPTIQNAELPEKLQGFTLQDNEDVLRANYFGPATMKQFVDFYVKSLQVYLAGGSDYETFASELNKEWTSGMKAAMATNGWTKENNYGMKK